MSINKELFSKLELCNLTIANGKQILLKSVGFEIVAGKTSALMGASGVGKSLCALALQGALPSNLTKISGEVVLNGKILRKSEIRANRGKIIASVLQNPRSCFNPLLSMQSHIRESLSALNKPFVRNEVQAILRKVGLESSVLQSYAFELSGGMLQRVMIALALLSGAEFIIADEATTDLDKIMESRILGLLKELQEARNLGILLISHDRRVVEFMADRIYEIRVGRGGNSSFDVGNLSVDNHCVDLTVCHKTCTANVPTLCQISENSTSTTPPTSIVKNSHNGICHPKQSRVSKHGVILRNLLVSSVAMQPKNDNGMDCHALDSMESNTYNHDFFCHIQSNAQSILNNPQNRDILLTPNSQNLRVKQRNHITKGEQNALVAQNISKTYTRYTLFGRKEKRILKGVHLRVSVGECVALLGASGSGKSTLARVLSALENIDSEISTKSSVNVVAKIKAGQDKKDFCASTECGGQCKAKSSVNLHTNSGIYLNGWEVTQKSLANLAKRREFYRQVQILFQDPISSLNPRLTLRESLAEPLRNLLGIFEASEQEARILPMLERLRIESSLLDFYPAMLSGGQAARFCLARALLVRPKYVILDEVTSGVDERLEGDILGFLRELERDEGLGVLLITHSAVLARKWCERIYIMQWGEIIEEVGANETFESDFGMELDRLSGFCSSVTFVT